MKLTQHSKKESTESITSKHKAKICTG